VLSGPLGATCDGASLTDSDWWKVVARSRAATLNGLPLRSDVESDRVWTACWCGAMLVRVAAFGSTLIRRDGPELAVFRSSA
jgi:hypothetical protein